MAQRYQGSGLVAHINDTLMVAKRFTFICFQKSMLIQLNTH